MTLGLGLAVLMPSLALATSECGTGSTVVCTTAGNPYPNGIFYIPSADQTIDLNSGVVVSTGGSLNPGIFVLQTSPTGIVTISGPTNVSITTTDSGAFGVLAASNAGAITINIDSVNTSGDSATGVDGSSATGTVNITANHIVTSGANAEGVNADTNAGAITVNTTNVSTTGNGSNGLDAHSDTKAVTVTSGAITTTGSSAAGILASSGFGPVNVTSTTINTGGAGSTGIDASSGTGLASVTSTSIITTGAGANGIVINPNRQGSGLINSGTVSATGAGSIGIQVFGSGNETINSGAVTADSTGIAATTLPLFSFGPPTNIGVIAITTTGNIGSKTGAAIDATSGPGSIIVTTGAGTTLSAATYGIHAVSSGIGDGGTDGLSDGNVTVVDNAGIGASGARVSANAIDAAVTNATSAGKVSVTLGSGAALFSTQQGVLATNAGTGTGAFTDAGVSVSGAATSSIDANGGFNGIEATITNAANKNGVVVNELGDIANLTGSGDGIRASTTGLGGVTVTTGVGHTIAGGDDAIQADISNAADTQAINVAVNGALNPNAASGVGFGVFSTNAGTGGTSITIASTGSVSGRAARGIDASVTGTGGALTVVNNGAIGSATTSVLVDGIDATIGNPANAAALSVSGTGSIFATGVGIDATNAGLGASSITSGAITSGDDGVNLTSVGAYTVTANGPITSGANAIQTNGTNGGAITIGSGVIVRGLGTSATTAVIDITAPVGKTNTITNNGIIRSTNATLAGAAGDLAIHATGGSVVFNNAGRLDGRMDFSGLGVGSNVTVNNTSASSIHTTGTTTFSAGNDTFNNTASGLLATSGATTFDFGADTGVAPRDVFNNAGTVVVGETAGPSTFTLAGLETFNNSGLIVLGSTNGGATSDGETNDRIVMTGTGGGTAFVGTGASTLALDANLGVATQTNCSAAVVADCLSLPGGTVSGLTKLRINDTNTGPGGLNTTGIVLVDAPGGSIAAGSLVIDPTSARYTTRAGIGAIDTGLFFYRLVPIGTTQEALVSAPDSEAFEFVELGQAVTDVWYTTTGTWFDREADLRDGVEVLNPSGGHAGVWLKSVGDWSQRRLTQSTTSLGTTFTFDTSYDQNTAAIIGGLDLLNGSSGSRAWVLGVDGGYVDSNVNFRASPTRVDMTGGVYGVYASAIDGPWYLDANFQGDSLRLNDSIPTLDSAPGTAFHTQGNAQSLGVQTESGWRFGMGGISLEPFSSLSYVSTRFSGMPLPGGSVRLANDESFRGSLGVRVSSTIQMGGYEIKPTIYGRAWDEWMGRDNSELINPGSPVFASDRFRGVFGEAGGQLALFSKGGLSAFVDASYKWKNDYTDYRATVGARYQF